MPRKSITIGDLPARLNERSRYYEVPVPIAGTGKRRWISTGCRSIAEASKVVAESGVNRLVHLANAKAVTAAAIQIITSGRKITCIEILGSLTMESSGRWADSTLALYRGNISAFFRFLNCETKPLIDVTRAEVLEWVNSGGAAFNTRGNRMSALRVLFRYARARNFVLENPAEDAFVDRRKMSQGEIEPARVEPFTFEEYHQIAAGADVAPFWRSVTSIAYWTGLRFSDCVTLEWSSVTETGLIVWTRKRGRRVELPLADPLLGGGFLFTVLQELPRSGPYLFPMEREQYLSGRRSRFPTAFQVLLGKLGIQGKSFHSTRHACATRLAAAGKTLEQIGKVLAHSDTNTTQIYVHAET